MMGVQETPLIKCDGDVHEAYNDSIVKVLYLWDIRFNDNVFDNNIYALYSNIYLCLHVVIEVV